jgi:Flp pilus assembly protein TadD
MNKVDERIDKANEFRQKGEFEKAVKEIQSAVETSPNDDELRVILGSYYFDMEEFEKAAFEFEKATKLNPQNAEGYNSLGDCWEQLGNKLKNLEYKQEAVRAAPTDLLYRVNLGLACDSINDSKSAKENVLKALEISPNYAYALYQMGDFELSDKNTTKAIEYFEKASKAKPIEDNDAYFIEQAKEKLADLKSKNPIWMKIHLRIIACLQLLLGGFMFVSLILGHYIFFTSGMFKFESSVLDTSLSFLDRLSDNFQQYLQFLAFNDMDGTDILENLVWVILLFTFGIGLLKLKDWARKLGFILIALNIITFGSAVYYGYLSLPYVIEIIFTFYMAVVLSSEKTKNLFVKSLNH